jgi:hypothetical protein
MSIDNLQQRERVLTDADLEALKELLSCDRCAFTPEEVQFVRDWMDTAKTAKSEVIKWIVRGIFFLIGLMALLQVGVKSGYLKGVAK